MGLKIGIIGGLGWIGKGVATGLLKSAVINPRDLFLSCRADKKHNDPEFKNVTVMLNNQMLVDKVDVVILSVRPQDFLDVHINADNKLVISVMAGVSCDLINKHTNSKCVVRSMPNAAVEIQQSYTPWFCNADLTQEKQQLVQKILSSFGKAQRVNSERDINFLTALTGSGHGTVALIESVLIKVAENYGLSKDISETAVKQLFAGMGLLLNRAEADPSKDVKKVIDYAGTTAALVLKMQANGLLDVIQAGINAGFEKASADMTK